MKIAFSSIDSLQLGLDTLKPSHLVSVYSPGWPPADVPDVKHTTLPMHDIERKLYRSNNVLPPNHKHVEAFLRVLSDRPERLLIRCTAGLSRSPALAIIAAVGDGWTAREACAEVRRLVPHAQPNRRLLAVADEVKGRNDLLDAALDVFTYTRGYDRPSGDRAGLSVLFEDHRSAARID